MEHQVKRFINDITRVHRALSQTADLRPSELVNGLFGELVSLCNQTLSTSSTKQARVYDFHPSCRWWLTSSQILEDQRIQDLTPSLRKLCATAESHLESHWAAHISGAAESEDEIGVNYLTGAESLTEATAFRRLGQFPYYENYQDLTHMELCAIHAVNASPPRKIAFVGSGPLPLSSLCLCQALDKLRRTAGFTTVLKWVFSESLVIVSDHFAGYDT
jgi:nicotianamine synthase